MKYIVTSLELREAIFVAGMQFSKTVDNTKVRDLVMEYLPSGCVIATTKGRSFIISPSAYKSANVIVGEELKISTKVKAA